MLWLLLLAAQAEVAPTFEEEVIVTAQRVRRISYRVGLDRKTKRIECRLLKSSGDPILDARICDMARACTPARVTNKDRAKVLACITPREKAIIRERAAERRAERARTGG